MHLRSLIILLALIAGPLTAADDAALLPADIDIADTISNDAVLQAINGEAGAPAGERVPYFADNDATSGYLAVPDGDGPFPAVILIHEWNGLVERIQQTADAFAEQGYVALAADLYQGQTGSNRDENIALMRAARADEQAIIDNLNAAVDYIRTQTPASGKVATIGWCFGGGIACPMPSAAMPTTARQSSMAHCWMIPSRWRTFTMASMAPLPPRIAAFRWSRSMPLLRPCAKPAWTTMCTSTTTFSMASGCTMNAIRSTISPPQSTPGIASRPI